MSSTKALARVVPSLTPDLISSVVDLARAYPFPHSIFNGRDVAAYVRKLNRTQAETGEGWFTCMVNGQESMVAATAHLSVYGYGRRDGHTLWKIRHPLARPDSGSDVFEELFLGLAEQALLLMPGTAKLVMFLGEHERDAANGAIQAGFNREASLADYYRLDEICYIYGKTLRQP